jgi:hypothetical protein
VNSAGEPEPLIQRPMQRHQHLQGDARPVLTGHYIDPDGRPIVAVD